MKRPVTLMLTDQDVTHLRSVLMEAQANLIHRSAPLQSYHTSVRAYLDGVISVVADTLDQLPKARS